MDTDAFWQLIADSLEHASGRSARERFIKDQLAACAAADVVAFQAILNRTCNHAFTWDLWGAAVRIFGGWCSDDGFDYFRLWLVGQGRATFECAVTSPDSLAGVPAISRLAGRPRREWDDDEEWPEWESLACLAKEAYELAGGNACACGEDFYDAVKIQLDGTEFKRNPDGERWAAKDEVTAALKIPLLVARFPLS